MKKIFLFCFMLFCFVGIANAQWRYPFYSEGDELTGLSDCWMHTYKDSDGGVIFIDNLNTDKNLDNIFFSTSESIFDYDFDFSSGYQYTYCIIGFYSDNKLIEKITIEVWVFSDMGDVASISPFDNSRNFSIEEKIFKHLTTVGDVRFVIPIYGTGYFDVTVTKNSELFKNTAK